MVVVVWRVVGVLVIGWGYWSDAGCCSKLKEKYGGGGGIVHDDDTK